jgi:uncharacterized metal-binding protein YceD (DUF177 family)
MPPVTSPHAVRVDALSRRHPHEIDLRPDAAEVEALRQALNLEALRKLRLSGRLDPMGARDWQFSGTLCATVVQPCVATLDPVTTRIDTPVERRFLEDFTQPEEPEAEMPEDADAEPLAAVIDPMAILIEALSLALPAYPRADGAQAVEMAVTTPGAAPLTDADVHPFSDLADLRARMTERDED